MRFFRAAPRAAIERTAAAIAVLCLAATTSAFAQQATDPTAALLQDVIRANSSNPPGVTQGIADVLGPKSSLSSVTVL